MRESTDCRHVIYKARAERKKKDLIYSCESRMTAVVVVVVAFQIRRFNERNVCAREDSPSRACARAHKRRDRN